MKQGEIKQILSRNLRNLKGWQTRRKVIVFESDDWGSIRMPDKYTFNKLLEKGVRVDDCPYNRYDSLASEDDLTELFETLLKFRDINNNHPIITANCLIANPDFDKIRSNGFCEYYYEIFTDSLKRYPNHSNSFKLWEAGMKERLFHPQFHGREHLHVKRWMKGLRQNLPETRLAFDHKLFGISTSISSEGRKSYLAAYDIDDLDDEIIIKEIIKDGLMHFRKIFGYASKSFIAPNYYLPQRIEKTLFENGIKYIQGQRIQLSPEFESDKVKKISRYIGHININRQIYTVRNCHFEPSLFPKKNSVGECLAQIGTAFRWNKPAIISSHRVNFIGTLDESNRKNNLTKFKELLYAIQSKWPDAEFMTSDELGDTITNSLILNNEQ
ncbi:MAG TPA: hypothetical protein ENO27_01390 [Caldithrix sp.]|nr:hypothetical protein [Caldithrix sp.]